MKYVVKVEFAGTIVSATELAGDYAEGIKESYTKREDAERAADSLARLMLRLGFLSVNVWTIGVC